MVSFYWNLDTVGEILRYKPKDYHGLFASKITKQKIHICRKSYFVTSRK